MTTINHQGQTLAKRVYDILVQFPEGLTSAELTDLLPEVKGGGDAISSILTNLKSSGVVKVTGSRPSTRSTKILAVHSVAKDYSEHNYKKPAKTTPTAAGLQARLSEALSKIEALEAWKADAIKRFPILGVEPSLAEARERVAAFFRENGDPERSKEIQAGLRDKSPMVLFARQLIEEGS